MRNIVNALLLKAGAVLLARRSSPRKAYPNCWSFPGGHVEQGESLDEALIREVQEDVGLTPRVFRKVGTIKEPNPLVNGKAIYHMYAVSDWDGGEPKMLGGEHSEIRWFGVNFACGLPDLAMEEYKAIFQRIR